MRPNYVQIPKLTTSYLGLTDSMLQQAWSTGNSISDHQLAIQWVYVLPSLKKGRIVNVWNTIPPNCPYKNYKEIRRHWKNAVSP